MYFKDRNDAAERLSEKLARYQNEHPLILGIPRGSVPMAKVLADHIHGDLDVILVQKVGAPDNPEFALGSVSEFGTVYRSHGADFYGVTTEELQWMAEPEIKKLRVRRETYSPFRPPVDPAGRTVILVDDGIATGSTMIAAVRAVRARIPKKVIVAAPVASPDAVELLRSEVDDLIVLDSPSDFFSISQFYAQFPQVSDDEVEQALAATGRIRKTRPAA